MIKKYSIDITILTTEKELAVFQPLIDEMGDSCISVGAKIIDIGCESSRPGAQSISVDEELDRLSIINKVRFENKILSIDSYKPRIIEYCLNKGFTIPSERM